MSISFCGICKTSKNVAECCNRATFMDESFESLPRDVPMNVLADGLKLILANASRTPEESPFDKMNRLGDEIENLGWDAWRLQNSGELERAKNLLAVKAQKEIELKALVSERRKCL